MSRLPAEFSTLLATPNPRMQSVADGNLLVAPGAIARRRADSLVRLLDRHMRKHLRALESPIPPQAITGMKKNYSERLPKTLRIKTLELNRKGSKGYETADELGLVRLMRSESLREFAQDAVGARLYANPNVQVICYEEGDYSGPHNDHHPEDPLLRDGYVDVHINLPNDSVAHQWLVCERDGMLCEIVGLSSPGAINVYRLPFWHYTTPLVTKRGRRDARRWLLLATFAQVS